MSFIKDSGKLEKAFNAVANQKEYSTWSCLLKEYRFFNPGILYWHTGLDRCLVSDFINQHDIPIEFRPKRVQVSKSLYKMSNPVVDLIQGSTIVKEDLSKMLYVCPNKSAKVGEPTIWEQLREFIESISFVNVKTGFYACAVEQNDLKIVDYQAFENSKWTDNMYLPVAAWGLYTNKNSVLWRTPVSKGGTYSVPVASVVDVTEMSKEDAMKLFKEL